MVHPQASRNVIKNMTFRSYISCAFMGNAVKSSEIILSGVQAFSQWISVVLLLMIAVILDFLTIYHWSLLIWRVSGPWQWKSWQFLHMPSKCTMETKANWIGVITENWGCFLKTWEKGLISSWAISVLWLWIIFWHHTGLVSVRPSLGDKNSFILWM